MHMNRYSCYVINITIKLFLVNSIDVLCLFAFFTNFALKIWID